MNAPTGPTETLVLRAAPFAGRHQAERCRLQVAQGCGEDVTPPIVSVTPRGTAGLFRSSCRVQALSAVQIDWWVFVVAATLSSPDATLIWGVPVILIWQTLQDCGLRLEELDELGGTLPVNGSALFWLDDGESRLAGPAEALLGSRRIRRIDLPAPLRGRLTEMIESYGVSFSTP